ncbi:FAD-binding oxidoreductase [Parapusillimonas granuli]|uniref:FAD-binding oxidoreductase n=1 Tax=Parapusillimonas granuli TaxID=380911 RepID=A0A853FXI5_9BURK|nr:FAD-binding oxidoreductase [Parapusillimonas granuli]MBB5215241.1 FAD/FMN-containing dehydrogenase [Parapusillimonas granuli]MEB2398424.1 FAD-binding oxidoreductase [Alcaligenaceae bacterium]NYT49558.1 FAD-binding oxidoreductase [Parapusillimonas granuli]
MSQIDELVRILGTQHVLAGEDAKPYTVDWRGRYSGAALAVAKPGTTDEVAQVVRWCAANNIPMVPQGGNTGLCGGATPDDSGEAVVISLARLNRVRGIDTDNDTMVAEAGCILQAVQQAAREADRLFPLSLAAEGSCTIGGNLATNAGGTQVLRYGNARDLVLGLEVVTAEGEVLHGLRGLRKDNTGYDLRNLYVGSEGTLGIITAASLKLYPLPVASCTALLALESVRDAVTVLSRARKGFGAALTGFELIAGNCLQGVVKCYPQQRIPFEGPSAAMPWYALLELSDSESADHARERFEAVVGDMLEAGLARDAVIAENITQSKALWHLRESIPLSEKEFGKSIKHDVSIPVSLMADFVETTNAALQKKFPGIQHVIFGHLGDGNLHYNVAPGGVYTEEELLSRQYDVYELVHDSVHRFHGSISAEHGVGQLKRDVLPRYKDPVEMALMWRIKQALDPRGLMNPGKVL